MRYGSPSIESVLKVLAETGIKVPCVACLIRHWAMSTTEPPWWKQNACSRSWATPSNLRCSHPSTTTPNTLKPCEETARTHLQPDDHLLATTAS